MTWLLGTEAGAIIWATLLAALGAAIRYSEPEMPPAPGDQAPPGHGPGAGPEQETQP